MGRKSNDYRALVKEVLDKQMHDPIMEMVSQAKTTGDPELKFAINKELAQYIAPKLRAVEISGDLEVNGEIKVVSFKDMTASDLDGTDK